MVMTPRKNTSCRRCGQCCDKGGPALHLEDLHLVRSGTLDLDSLVTLRAGEPVLDQPKGRVASLERELVKVARRGNGLELSFPGP